MREYIADTKAILLDKYSLTVNNVVVEVEIKRFHDYPVPKYYISITNISDTTKIILETEED